MKLIICQGLPGSGKSTFAKELVATSDQRWVRVNRDDLRAMLHNSVWSKANEQVVVSMRNAMISDAIYNGWNVISDDCNFGRNIEDLFNLTKGSTIGVDIEVKFFDVSVEECLRRNALRTGIARVPDAVIMRMYEDHVKGRG